MLMDFTSAIPAHPRGSICSYTWRRSSQLVMMPFSEIERCSTLYTLYFNPILFTSVISHLNGRAERIVYTENTGTCCITVKESKNSCKIVANVVFVQIKQISMKSLDLLLFLKLSAVSLEGRQVEVRGFYVFT